MQAQYNQDQQQQLMPTYPQPPRLTRPTSVLLEPSSGFQGQEPHQGNTRPRSQSQTIYSTYLPPPATAASVHSGTSSSISDPENPVRFQNWRQPAHRSKLSKQYTPSEEDSDEETAAANAEARRRSKFMSGAPLELNSIQERSRASSRLTMTLTPPRSATPSMSDKTDTVSVKSATKKLTLGKRISRFFGGGGSSKSSTTNAESTSDISSPSSSDYGRSADQSTAGTRTSRASSSASLTLPPVQELTPPERLHGASSLYNMHQRSHSTPEQIGSSQQHHQHQNAAAQYGAAPSLKLEENRLRKARDSGFEETERKNGHRRYSSTVVAVGNRGIPSAAGSSMPNLPQQQLQPHHPHQPHHSQSGSPQLRPYSDRESTLQQPPPILSHPNHRHSFMGAELGGSASPTSPRRSSTPVPHSSETLISKVDREKASVCFQQPNVRRDSFIRDHNLDPVLSNLVQQHRKDFKTNQRLGGSLTPTPQQQNQHQQQQGSPRTRSSSYMDDHLHHGHRRDSNGSQHHYYPPSPGLSASDAQMKRLSTSSQMLQQQQQHPYGQHHRSQATGSNGSLHQYQQQQQQQYLQGHPSPQPHHPHHHHSHHQPQQHQQQYHPQQHSPLVGPQRTSPKRQSSAGYFSSAGSMATLGSGSGSPLLMSHQLPQGSQVYHISPLPSPNMGAVSTMGYVPDLALPQQQQQLEQLQLIRIQQQQLLLQQQMQLQQQLQQTRAAAAVMASAPGSPLMMMPSSMSANGLNVQQQQQQQQLQGAIVMGPTLTTAVPLSAYPTGYP